MRDKTVMISGQLYNATYKLAAELGYALKERYGHHIPVHAQWTTDKDFEVVIWVSPEEYDDVKDRTTLWLPFCELIYGPGYRCGAPMFPGIEYYVSIEDFDRQYSEKAKELGASKWKSLGLEVLRNIGGIRVIWTF